MLFFMAPLEQPQQAALVPDLVAGSLASVVQPRIARMRSEGTYPAGLRMFLRFSLPGAALAFVAAVLLADPVIPLVLGAGSRPGIPIFLWLLAGTLFWLAVTGTGVCNQVIWGMRYEEMKKTAAATGAQIRSSWGESLNTVWAFPLWENLVIYTLFIFLAWFTLAMPNEIPQRAKSR